MLHRLCAVPFMVLIQSGLGGRGGMKRERDTHTNARGAHEEKDAGWAIEGETRK